MVTFVTNHFASSIAQSMSAMSSRKRGLRGHGRPRYNPDGQQWMQGNQLTSFDKPSALRFQQQRQEQDLNPHHVQQYGQQPGHPTWYGHHSMQQPHVMTPPAGQLAPIGLATAGLRSPYQMQPGYTADDRNPSFSPQVGPARQDQFGNHDVVPDVSPVHSPPLAQGSQYFTPAQNSAQCQPMIAEVPLHMDSRSPGMSKLTLTPPRTFADKHKEGTARPSDPLGSDVRHNDAGYSATTCQIPTEPRPPYAQQSRPLLSPDVHTSAAEKEDTAGHQRPKFSVGLRTDRQEEVRGHSAQGEWHSGIACKTSDEQLAAQEATMWQGGTQTSTTFSGSLDQQSAALFSAPAPQKGEPSRKPSVPRPNVEERSEGQGIGSVSDDTKSSDRSTGSTSRENSFAASRGSDGKARTNAYSSELLCAVSGCKKTFVRSSLPVDVVMTSAVGDWIKGKSSQKIRQRELPVLFNSINAMLNNGGGVMYLHVETQMLHFLDEQLDDMLKKMVPDDGTIFSQNFDRIKVDDCHVTVRVIPRDRFISTKDFKTKVAMNKGLVDPSHLQMLRRLKHATSARPTSATTCSDSCRFPFDLRRLSRDRSIPGFHENTRVEAKSIKHNESKVRTAEEFIHHAFKDLKLRERISAFNKEEGGGSYFVGVAEERENPNSDERTGRFTCEGVDLPQVELDKIQSQLNTMVKTDMLWHPAFPDSEPVQVRLHAVAEPMDDAVRPAVHRPRFVVEIFVRNFPGISFTDSEGPEAYTFLHPDNPDHSQEDQENMPSGEEGPQPDRGALFTKKLRRISHKEWFDKQSQALALFSF